ncbi:hypothetical protein YC2023_089143 [Brassica napus]
MSQILDFIYNEVNGDIGTLTTHVKQPDIQVHHADESKQKDELNREKLVNHDTVEDNEYHVSGELSKDIADSTLKSIDVSSCYPDQKVEKEITMEDFLELEEFLEQKVDDQHTSGKGYPIEPGPIEEIMHMSKTSHIDVPKHLRPPICGEEAVGICKRVKRIHDPVKIMVPCAVFEVESPIPPDKDDARKSRVRLHKSVGKKGRNWKKRKRTKGGSQLPLTPYFSESIRKSRVRSKCFSHPYAKLKALLIVEMIDKGEKSMEEAFTHE